MCSLKLNIVFLVFNWNFATKSIVTTEESQSNVCKNVVLHIIFTFICCYAESNKSFEDSKKDKSSLFHFEFRKGLKYFILIDADNFIKKHFITKRKPI